METALSLTPPSVSTENSAILAEICVTNGSQSFKAGKYLSRFANPPIYYLYYIYRRKAKFLKFAKLLLVLFVSGMILSVCKTHVMTTVSLTENNNQKHIEIAVDDIIQLQLDESPTTGYRWEITELDSSNLKVISEDFKLNPDSGVGGGGKKTIQLKVLRKAAGRVRLENRQPWSGNVYKRFEVTYS